MHYRYKNLLVFLLAVTVIPACKKYLNASPDKGLVIPATFQDLQAVIDDNGDNNRIYMGLGEASADNYYLKDADWASMSASDRNTYTWGDDLFTGSSFNEYQSLYKSVYNANLVLETIPGIGHADIRQSDWDNLRGCALFFRARAFHLLVTTFATAYDSVTAGNDPGIALRSGTDFNVPSVRASVQESYSKIISDLNEAIPLLYAIPAHVMRPSKPAAYALLARTYLVMRNYKEAGLYADSALRFKNSLMDYNGGEGVNGPDASTPFQAFNPEVIFNANGLIIPIYFYYAKIDSTLYNSYDTNDLRHTLFFKGNGDGTYYFRGHYFSDGASLFYGLATDEMYLTRAECQARMGKTDEAMATLNFLLIKRWKTGTFSDFTAIDQNDALNQILRERRKELLMRDIRWMDIKRLNKEGANISLRRVVGGQSYDLLPNDNRFALPFPKYIVDLTGMPQNIR
jgi:hypothetical protein